MGRLALGAPCSVGHPVPSEADSPILDLTNKYEGRKPSLSSHDALLPSALILRGLQIFLLRLPDGGAQHLGSLNYALGVIDVIYHILQRVVHPAQQRGIEFFVI